MDIPVQAALVAAAVTFVGILLRDLLFNLLKEKRQQKQSALSIYRSYADPLISSATSLLWRLNEILHEKGRGSYLRAATTEFEHYKVTSTVYRLASLLGWIRAYQRELSFLETYSRRGLRTLKEAIRSLVSALADGPHIEIQRLRGLAEIWDIELPDNNRRCSEVAILLNNVIKPRLHSETVAVASELSEEGKRRLCAECCRTLCEALGVNEPPSDLIMESKERAVRRIGIKEAWLYRDWQSAVGDIMIRQVSYGGRAFEVIGFAEFEGLYLANSPESGRWINRLSSIFNELDVEAEERFDARIMQLKRTMLATAQLVSALARIEKRHGILLKNTLSLAKSLLKECPSM